MPAKGCPLPIAQQTPKCKDCSLSQQEREQRCNWYRGMRQAISPLKMSLVSNGVLLLSFSITLLSQSNFTGMQKGLADVCLWVSVILAIFALLPQQIKWLSSTWLIGPLSSLTYIAWFFNFAVKWLDGITHTNDIERWLVSLAGIIWLFCLLMVLTRGITVVTAGNQKIKWVPFIIPLVMIWQTTAVFLTSNWIGGLLLLVFVVGSLLIAIKLWKPIGEFLIGVSR